MCVSLSLLFPVRSPRPLQYSQQRRTAFLSFPYINLTFMFPLRKAASETQGKGGGGGWEIFRL